MQFKHPAILYFLFALVIPILVHLFQLRRFKKEFFTNVRFLKELSIQTRKSSKIKKWLLLATRLLLLSCLIFAFAQPFFKSKDSKNSNNEMYIVLDNSFSMQAKGKKGELLKRAVQELLENTPENLTFSLLTNTENYWNTNIKSIQKELQNFTYSATPFELESVMAKIKAHKSVFNKDVVIITDAVGLQEKQTKSIDPDFNTNFIIPKAEKTNNMSIDSVFINQNLDNFYEIGIKISTYGENFKNIPIALYNKNKLIAKMVSDFESKEKTIKFTIPKDDFHGYVTIQDNGLEYDNTYFFSLSKPKKANVISIGESAKSNFLSRIYTTYEFTYANFETASLDYNLLEKQDAIVLNESATIPQALQTTLKSFVQKGGNLIIIPAQESAISEVNTFLNNFGATQFTSIQNIEKLITKINFSHPLFSAVFEKKIDNFQYPNTKFSFGLKTASSPVLSYQDQTPFLISIQNPISSVFVFAAPINKTNSNFQNSPLIVPVFYKMAQNSQKTGVNAQIIGESNPVLIDALLSKDEILEVKNADEKFIPTQQILNNKVKMTFNDNPQQAGNFGVFDKDKLLQNISFNYNRTESNLDQVNTGAVSDFETGESLETLFTKIQTNRTDSQVWKWFIIFALLFLLTELFIQKFVK